MYTIHTLVKEPKKTYSEKLARVLFISLGTTCSVFRLFVLYILYTELFRPSSLNHSVLALFFYEIFPCISPPQKMRDFKKPVKERMQQTVQNNLVPCRHLRSPKSPPVHLAICQFQFSLPAREMEILRHSKVFILGQKKGSGHK
jgi:hypothetical protein